MHVIGHHFHPDAVFIARPVTGAHALGGRSRDLLSQEMCNTYPEYRTEIESFRLDFVNYLYWRSISMRNVLQSLIAAKLLFLENPIIGTKLVFLTLAQLARGFCRRRAPTGMLLFFRSAMRNLGIFGSLVEKLDREILRRHADLGA